MGSPQPASYRFVFYLGSGLVAASFAAGLVHAVGQEGRLPTLGPLGHRQGVEAREASGDLLGAAAELRMLTLIDPGDCRSFDDLAAVLERAGDPAGALDVRLRHVALHPQSAAAHRQLGLAFLEAGRGDDAFGSLSAALRLDPRDATSLTALGDVERERMRFDPAIAAYRRALATAHEPALVHNKLGITLARAGRTQDAARHFEEALRLDPELELARRNLELLAAAAPRPGGTP